MEAVAALEEWVDLSVKDGPYKAEASRQLDLLRADPSRWAIGIRTFQESKKDVVRFFGLSLIRDFLVQDANTFVADIATRKFIREACWMWIEAVSNGSTVVPNYMMNSMTSILTLCIKRDYPEQWPSAFDNLLDLGTRYELLGTEIVIKVLQELEVEVVMFNESRSREEVAHNTLIKDHMRASDTVVNIVVFLCQVAHRALSGNPHLYSLAVKGLECLAELIGWIDIGLVTQRALPTIYAALDAPPGLAAAALHCVLEICKKGMDPVAKFQLLHSLQVVPILLSKDYIKRFTHISLPYVEDSESDEVRCVRHFALCLDMILVEGLGIWMRFEELAVVPAAPGPSPTVEKGKGSRRKRGEAVSGLSDLNPILVPLAQILVQVSPQAFQLVQQKNISIYRAIQPSISKYIQLLRSQKAALQITCGKCVFGPNGESFQASGFIDDLLVALQLQSQLPDDFDFEGLDDEDQEAIDIMEAKNEARKLFINCARSHGSRCLELLQHILSHFPRPLSQVSFPPLESTLRLLQAFPESEDRDAVVPRMVLFLYTQPDLMENSHPQVQIALHELCLRWLARQATAGAAEAQVLAHGAQALCLHIESHAALSPSKYHQSLRSKLVHLLLKYTEAFDENRFLLFQLIGQRVIGLLVRNSEAVIRDGLLRGNLVRCNTLSDSAEVALFDVLALLATCTLPSCGPDGITVTASDQGIVLAQCVDFLCQQVQAVESAPIDGDVRGRVSAQLLACLTAVLKRLPDGHETLASMHNAASFVLQRHPTNTTVRGRTVAFLHHLLERAGATALAQLSVYLDLLLAHLSLSDVEAFVSIFTQLCVLCGSHAEPLVRHYHPSILACLQRLSEEVEAAHVAGICTESQSESDRLLLAKQMGLYLQHLLSHSILSVAMGDMHRDSTLHFLMVGLKGIALSGARISRSSALPQRRTALLSLNCLLDALHAASTAGPMEVSLRPLLERFIGCEVVPIVFLSLGAPRSGSNNLQASAPYYLLAGEAYEMLKLNLLDAASQGVVTEAAVLLYEYARFYPQSLPLLREFLATRLDWSAGLCDALLAPLSDGAMPVGSFKDHLKAFAKRFL